MSNCRHVVANRNRGILISPLPVFNNLKPGSATKPFFGISPIILNEKGEEQLEALQRVFLPLRLRGRDKCELFMATIDLLMFIFQNLRVITLLGMVLKEIKMDIIG